MQRASSPESATLGIERSGGRQCSRIDCRDRVELGTAVFIGGDAIEVECHELLTRETTRIEGRIDVRDCDFFEPEDARSGISCHRRTDKKS